MSLNPLILVNVHVVLISSASGKNGSLIYTNISCAHTYIVITSSDVDISFSVCYETYIPKIYIVYQAKVSALSLHASKYSKNIYIQFVYLKQ